MRDQEKNQGVEVEPTTSTRFLGFNDEPPAAALALAGHCLLRLAPLFPALLGQFVRDEKMTRICVRGWALAIAAARVEEQDLARAIRDIAKGDGGPTVDPFSFPSVIGLAKSFRRNAASFAPAPPSAPPASEEKIQEAMAAIKAAFRTETLGQH